MGLHPLEPLSVFTFAHAVLRPMEPYDSRFLYRSYRAFDRSFHGPWVRNPSVMTYPPYGGFACA